MEKDREPKKESDSTTRIPSDTKAQDREEVEDLILQNQTLDALIKGLTADIEIFKEDKTGRWSPQDIVRFTMQLNVMRDKKVRNLAAINTIVAKHKEAKV
jgi:hypothetical protein